MSSAPTCTTCMYKNTTLLFVATALVIFIAYRCVETSLMFKKGKKQNASFVLNGTDVCAKNNKSLRKKTYSSTAFVFVIFQSSLSLVYNNLDATVRTTEL